MRAPALHASVADRVGTGAVSVESRRPGRRRPGRRRPVCLAAGTWLACVFLVAAVPVDAGMLDRVTLGGGVGHAIKKNFGRLSDLLPKTVDAVARDDQALLGSIMREVEATPGHLIRDAFPVLKGGNALARGLAAARRKLGRLVGRAGATVRDARAALVGRGREEELLAATPLAVPKLQVLPVAAGEPSPGVAPASGAVASSAWDVDPPPPGDTQGYQEHETRAGNQAEPDADRTRWEEGGEDTEPAAAEIPGDDYEAALQAIDAGEGEPPGDDEGESERWAAAAPNSVGGLLDPNAAGVPDGPGGTALDDYEAALQAMDAREAELLDEVPGEFDGDRVAADGPLHGSIAFSQEVDGAYAWGMAWSFGTAADAAEEAIELCRAYGGGGCQAVGGFKEACGALAIGSGNGYGTGWGATTAAAERNALAECRSANVECRFEAAQCSQSEQAGGSGRREDDESLADGPGPRCAGAPGPACWMETANQPGCHVWNPKPQADESVTWSGPCVAGKASGHGEVAWRWREDGRAKTSAGTGELRDGTTRYGHWVVRYDSGEVWEGSYVNDRYHGHWVRRGEDGAVWSCWRDGERVDPDACDSPAEGRMQTTTAVELRSGPGHDYEATGRLAADAAVTVTGRAGEWVRVETADGRAGLVLASALAEIETVTGTCTFWDTSGHELNVGFWSGPCVKGLASGEGTATMVPICAVWHADTGHCVLESTVTYEGTARHGLAHGRGKFLGTRSANPGATEWTAGSAGDWVSVGEFFAGKKAKGQYCSNRSVVDSQGFWTGEYAYQCSPHDANSEWLEKLRAELGPLMTGNMPVCEFSHQGKNAVYWSGLCVDGLASGVGFAFGHWWGYRGEAQDGRTHGEGTLSFFLPSSAGTKPEHMDIFLWRPNRGWNSGIPSYSDEYDCLLRVSYPHYNPEPRIGRNFPSCADERLFDDVPE